MTTLEIVLSAAGLVLLYVLPLVWPLRRNRT